MSIYRDDRYLQTRAVPVLQRDQLAGLNTHQLLSRLDRLRACIDSIGDTEYDEEDAALVNGILFKDSPEWQQAYAELKEILDTRPHVPGGTERARARKDRAARNRSKERRR